MEPNTKNGKPYVPRMLGALGADRGPGVLAELADALNVKLLNVRELGPGRDITDLSPNEAAYFDSFGIVSTAVDITQPEFSKYFLAVERERMMRPLAAVEDDGSAAIASGCAFDTLKRTWGVSKEVTNVENTAYKGDGIKVAIIDSGIDLNHEAFTGVTIVLESPDAKVDHGGHGTHCAASICGQPESATKRLFGVAPRVELFVAKIFDAEMSAPDTRILQAIQWAVEDKKCDIVSMSIGAEIAVGTAYSVPFEQALALHNANVLFVAGVGNNSRRNVGKLAPVNHPANCPSVLAVSAIDECMKIGNRANRSVGPNSGKVGLVAPGLRIHSAKANGKRDAYRLMDGTSAATAFAAGVAALWAQASGLRGSQLRNQIGTLALPIPDYDAGRGLVQAP